MNQINSPATIVLLYTDSGGTHRNAAEAIKEAIELEYGHRFRVYCVDIWKFSPFPMNWLPKLVHLFRERKRLSQLSIQGNQNPGWKRFFHRLSQPYLKRIMQSLQQKYPCDLMAAVHPLASSPVLSAVDGNLSHPFVVVVNDLATKNVFWFDPRADLTILPTDQARKSALQAGIPFAKTRLVGIPVSMSYCVPAEAIPQLRQRLGITPDKPVIVLAGGKLGVGPLEAIAKAIDETTMDIQLVVITGTNELLKKQLNRYNWKNDVQILGYVHSLWDWMWAADVLISKAGTGMLAEALSVGLPMILFNRVPYLEDANVTYLVDEGAAVWAPTPEMVIYALDRWLRNPVEREQAASACRRLAQPQAAKVIAEQLIDMIENSDK